MDKISVVVCVKNEEERIRACLEGIIKNSPDEIIVVDGNSYDNTVRIASEFTNKIIITKNSNLTRDRQIGINAANNNFIAMIDGDHVLEQGDLNGLLKDLVDNNYSIVQSQLKSYCNENWMNRGEEEMWELFHNVPGPKSMIGVAPAMYRKELFENIQFDDTVTSTIDDTDFIYRLSQYRTPEGNHIKYGIGNVKISQRHTSKPEDYYNKFRWYGIGDGEFCVKHPNRKFSMWFHLHVRYQIIYPIIAICKGKIYAARYCFIQGKERAKWMNYKIKELRTK